MKNNSYKNNKMEFELNGAKLRAHKDGQIEKISYGAWNATNKEPRWKKVNACIRIDKTGYKRNVIEINYKKYSLSRVLYYAFHQDWNINDSTPNNTIDHININSLDNNLSNLRIATAREQLLNQHRIINAKGYHWHKLMKKWKAIIVINRKQIHLGYFETEQEASLAYQQAKLSYLKQIDTKIEAEL